MGKQYVPVRPSRRASKYESRHLSAKSSYSYRLLPAGGDRAGCRFAPCLPQALHLWPSAGFGSPSRPYHTASFDSSPGQHAIWIGETLVNYYVPRNLAPAGGPLKPRELLFAIHGAGQEHFTGMESNIRRWGTDRVLDHPGGAVSSADANRVIIVAPAFERIYYPQSPEDQRPVKDLALEFLAYEASGSFPPGYLYPDAYLYDFVCLLKTYARYRDAPDVRFPNARCDTKLNEIFDAFRAFFSDVDQERFNLVGYSGGGQFVNRFATLYPDKLNRIAFGGAGSLLFPFFTVTYPYGLICSYDDVDWVEIWGNRHQDAPYIYGLDNFFRRHGWGDWAPDLVRITPWDWHLRLATLLQRKVFVYAGEFDFVGDDVTSPLYREPFWQGLGQYEKAKNFVKEMGVFDRYLKRIGMRKDWEPFQVVLNEGIEDAGLGHTDMDTAMYEWLRRHWWDCG